MRVPIFALLFSTFYLVVSSAYADSTNGYRDAQRIIVITDDEAIHYAQFCGFYELRELLTESVANVSVAMNPADAAIFEIRVLAKSGEQKAYVGDHWISTDEGTALLPTATYERIVDSVEGRKGHGTAKSKVGKSVKRILTRIQDPAYVEVNMCSKR